MGRPEKRPPLLRRGTFASISALLSLLCCHGDRAKCREEKKMRVPSVRNWLPRIGPMKDQKAAPHLGRAVRGHMQTGRLVVVVLSGPYTPSVLPMVGLDRGSPVKPKSGWRWSAQCQLAPRGRLGGIVLLMSLMMVTRNT